MIWETSETAPERILLMGPAGSGKSNAVMDIAEMVKGTVHVLDTELDVYQRLNKTRQIDMDIVGVLPDDWLTMAETVKGWSKTVGKGDWVVCDSMTPTWDAVANWFAEDVLGSSLADLALATRKEQTGGEKNLKLLDGWRDYQVINKLYGSFYNDFLKCTSRGAHVLWTSEVKTIPDEAPRETRALFGKMGMMPKGQGRMSHIPHTIIAMRRTRACWEMETVKDQERGEVDGEVTNFGKQYLAGVAGWQVSAS